MTVSLDITTKIEWTDAARERKLTVEVNPFDDMDVTYECPGTEDQVMNLDEPAWKALYQMMGEVKP